MSKITGASVMPFAPPVIQGVGNFGGFQFELMDQTNLGLSTLAKTTQAFMHTGNMKPQLRGVYSDFSDKSPQLLVEVDRERAKTLGVALTDIFSTLQVYLGSQYINDFDYVSRIYRVYVQADSPYRSNPADIGQFYVRASNGAMIPLSNLVKVTPQTAPQVISHYNLFRSTEINGSPAPGISSGQAMDIMEHMATDTTSKEAIMPKGMGYAWSGISLEQRESGSQTIFIFALGLAFVFLVLAAQYESFTDPLIILLAIPLAILGALLAQSIRGLEDDVYCQVGLVMLIGLASKNAILIVEFANQLRQQGHNIYDAAVEAAETRFRPIVMTSLAFILGILPLVLAHGAGAESRHSLGTAVFGGMLLSTILSLYLVPVLYIVIENARENVVAWKARRFR